MASSVGAKVHPRNLFTFIIFKKTFWINSAYFFKLLVRTVRTRLSQIYTSLGDSDKALEHERAASELRIDCPGCGEDMGIEPEPLEALPCAHILHAR